jgi:hypothetical protein
VAVALRGRGLRDDQRRCRTEYDSLVVARRHQARPLRADERTCLRL